MFSTLLRQTAAATDTTRQIIRKGVATPEATILKVGEKVGVVGGLDAHASLGYEKREPWLKVCAG
jgi:hypothetical protein